MKIKGSEFKKIVFILIISEVIVILYLFNNAVQTGKFAKIKTIIAETPKELVTYELRVNSSFDHFYTYNPNTNYITNNRLFGTIVYETNSDGLRERYDYTKEKPENVFRIGFFGDSFVYGQYVNVTHIFTEIVEDHLNSLNCSKKIEVINFGHGGYDLPYMVELFKLKGKEFNSDINVFIIKTDDIDLINELWIPIFDKYLEQQDEPNPTMSAEEFYRFTEAKKKAKDEYFELKNNLNQTLWLEEHIIKSFKTLSKENAGESKIIIFTFLINPDYNEILREESKKYGFTFLSLDDFNKDYSKLWDNEFSVISRIDEHPNKLGHQFLANFFYTYFISENFINC